MEKRQDEFALTFELRESIVEFLSEYQFAASPKTLRYHEDNVGRCLLKFLTEHGAQDIQDVTPHRFRQTLATEHYRANRDLIALKAALGHSKVETTMTYLRGLGRDFALDAEHPSPDEWLVE